MLCGFCLLKFVAQFYANEVSSKVRHYEKNLHELQNREPERHETPITNGHFIVLAVLIYPVLQSHKIGDEKNNIIITGWQ